MGLTLVNVAAATFETAPGLEAHFGKIFEALEDGSLIAFASEYVLRFWSCAEDASVLGVPIWLRRLRWMASPGGVVDLLSILPFVVGRLLGPGDSFCCAKGFAKRTVRARSAAKLLVLESREARWLLNHLPSASERITAQIRRLVVPEGSTDRESSAVALDFEVRLNDIIQEILHLIVDRLFDVVCNDAVAPSEPVQGPVDRQSRGLPVVFEPVMLWEPYVQAVLRVHRHDTFRASKAVEQAPTP